MKLAGILATMCALLFFSAGIVKADEISDLKEQMKALQETVSALNAKIQTLETKQESQGKETTSALAPDLQQTVNALNTKIQTLEAKQESQANEAKKVSELDKTVSGLKQQAADLLGGVTVGAHLKFAMADRTQGTRNGVHQKTDLSAGFVGSHNLILYFTKELEKWLKIDIQPEVDVSASATPSLGSNITRVTSSSTSIKIHQAFMTVYLPRQYELKVGTFNAMFSEDYAKETWWQELYNMNVGKCSLVALHDSGAELYKNFDFENWSLPIYLTYLNGGSDQNVDNNEAKSVLVHIAPEFFQSKLKLLGSLVYGKWASNKDSYKSLAGFDWKYKRFNLLGEYIYQVYDNVLLPAAGSSPTARGEKSGYWFRAAYTINPRWRVLVENSFANLYKAGTAGQTSMLWDKYSSTSFALDFSLTPNSTIIGQYEIGQGRRSDDSEKLRFGRSTIGWRTTF